jgi:hypothetical protein
MIGDQGKKWRPNQTGRTSNIGVCVFTSLGDDLTESDYEMRVAMRQIAGVFSQRKTRLVKKLRVARERKRPKLQAAIAMAKRLRRAPIRSLVSGAHCARSPRSLPRLATSTSLGDHATP